jgi:four helix bundle protein
VTAMNAGEVTSYRDLIAWQKGMDLVCCAYHVTKSLPPEEKYGLTAQMRRSAVSIPSNVAEGWGRHFGADFIRHLQMARGSTFELSTQAEICNRLGFAGEWHRVVSACDEIGRVINGLITSVQRNLDQS